MYSLHEALGVRRVDALLGHVSQSVGDWLLVLAALPPQMGAGVKQGNVERQQINIAQRLEATQCQQGPPLGRVMRHWG